jgi:hypothetical protein
MKAIVAKGQNTKLAVGYLFKSKKECRALIANLKERLKKVKAKTEDFAFMFDVEDVDLHKEPPQ